MSYGLTTEILISINISVLQYYKPLHLAVLRLLAAGRKK